MTPPLRYTQMCTHTYTHRHTQCDPIAHDPPLSCRRPPHASFRIEKKGTRAVSSQSQCRGFLAGWKPREAQGARGSPQVREVPAEVLIRLFRPRPRPAPAGAPLQAVSGVSGGNDRGSNADQARSCKQSCCAWRPWTSARARYGWPERTSLTRSLPCLALAAGRPSRASTAAVQQMPVRLLRMAHEGVLADDHEHVRAYASKPIGDDVYFGSFAQFEDVHRSAEGSDSASIP